MPGREADGAEATRLLTELGLTINEARVYLALLRSECPTAAEAATAAGVPRPKVYEALQALEGRGFSKSIGGRVRRFVPVDPESALRGWLQSSRARARRDERARSDPRGDAGPAASGAGDRRREAGRGLHRGDLRPGADDGGARRPRLTRDADAQHHAAAAVRTAPAALERDGGRGARAGRPGPGDLHPPGARGRTSFRGHPSPRRAGANARAAADEADGPRPRGGTHLAAEAGTGAQSVTTVAVRHPDLVAPLITLFEQQWKKARALPSEMRPRRAGSRRTASPPS